VVHITAGVAGLVAALIVVKRRLTEDTNEDKQILPYNLVFSFIGAAILWFGWFGFNGGSTYAFDDQAILAILNTQIAASAGLCAWLLVESIYSKPSAIGAASGAIAGLVAITPAAGYVLTAHAAIFGFLSGIACFYACVIVKKQFGYDDALDAFGIHGVGGIIGAILTGIFANKLLTNGIIPSVTAQFKGVIFTVLYTGIVSTILLKTIQKVIGLRVASETEQIGLDIGQHGSKVED
jgi:Amt family ammonium transporter